MSISPVKQVDPRAAAGVERAAPKKDAGLARAAAEMESVFVRHLLEAAKIGGPSGQSGYGSMAVDALATGIQQGGGLGLTRRIEEALSQHHAAPPVASLTPVAQPHAAAPAASPDPVAQPHPAAPAASPDPVAQPHPVAPAVVPASAGTKAG